MREVGTRVQAAVGKGYQPFFPSCFNLEMHCLHAPSLCITTEQLENVHKDAHWGSRGCLRQLGESGSAGWLGSGSRGGRAIDSLNEQVLGSYSISLTVQLPSSLPTHRCAI